MVQKVLKVSLLQNYANKQEHCLKFSTSVIQGWIKWTKDFLGHNIRVHRQFYRHPEGTLQLAKISKVVMALDQGRLAEFKGKTLDDINIDPEGTLPGVASHKSLV